MDIKDFDYYLPESLIAQRPSTPREAARLLVVKPNDLTDTTVGNFPDFLRAGDLLVFNDTKVLPARLIGIKNGKTIEFLLHRLMPDGNWQAMARGAKKLRPCDRIEFAPGFHAEILSKDPELGFVYITLVAADGNIPAALQRYGHMPIPPYFNRQDDDLDRKDYQTIFADKDGAVAAPTAGLHFTPDLLKRCMGAGADYCTVTLHVGAGTFAPLRTDRIADHVMHKEWYDVPRDTAEKITKTKQNGGRVIAVGTTVARSLESAACADGTISAQNGDTQIFITPGYKFKIIDLLVTNFHLPKSTLMMLVSAFSGTARIKSAYAHAIENNYRFYSYGDACLLYPGS